MPRLKRAESQARTRQQILDAAAVVFARRGFHAASIDEVAEDASYTKGAVYSNFGSKEELFLAVLEARLHNQVEFFRGLAQQARQQRGQSLADLLPRLDDTDEVWCLLEFEFWLYALRNPTIGGRMAELYRQYRAELAPLAASYANPNLTPDEVVAGAIALYHGLTLQRHTDPDGIRPDLGARFLNALRVASSATDGVNHPRSIGAELS